MAGGSSHRKTPGSWLADVTQPCLHCWGFPSPGTPKCDSDTWGCDARTPSQPPSQGCHADRTGAQGRGVRPSLPVVSQHAGTTQCTPTLLQGREVPEATSHPPRAHAAASTSPDPPETPTRPHGQRSRVAPPRSACTVQKSEGGDEGLVEQAASNTKGKMEVEGEGLQGWGPKAVGRDGGSEHVSGPWGGSTSLVPAATRGWWGRVAAGAPGCCAPLYPCVEPPGQAGGGSRLEVQWHGHYPKPILATAQGVPAPTPQKACPVSNPRACPHLTGAGLPTAQSLRSSSGRGEGKGSPGGGEEMAAGRRWPQRDVPSAHFPGLLTRGARAPVLGTG